MVRKSELTNATWNEINFSEALWTDFEGANEAAQPAPTETGSATPTLTIEPMADCSRYDDLRSVNHVH